MRVSVPAVATTRPRSAARMPFGCRSGGCAGRDPGPGLAAAVSDRSNQQGSTPCDHSAQVTVYLAIRYSTRAGTCCGAACGPPSLAAGRRQAPQGRTRRTRTVRHRHGRAAGRSYAGAGPAARVPPPAAPAPRRVPACAGTRLPSATRVPARRRVPRPLGLGQAGPGRSWMTTNALILHTDTHTSI